MGASHRIIRKIRHSVIFEKRYVVGSSRRDVITSLLGHFSSELQKCGILGCQIPEK